MITIESIGREATDWQAELTTLARIWATVIMIIVATYFALFLISLGVVITVQEVGRWWRGGG